MKTRKVRSSFTWTADSCNTKYFDSLIAILNKVNIPKNTGAFIRPRFTRKKGVCEKILIKDCALDDFHSGKDYLQLVLGRWLITSNCFTDCVNYFAMAMNKWSFFKNDTFIHHMIHNEFFYKKYNKLPLDPIFPIRIVLSNKFLIPPHRMRKTTQFIKDYGYDFFKGKAISDKIVKLIESKHPELMKQITKTLPLSHVISRELCLLKQDHLYFYVVKKNDQKLYKPYVLISEKPLTFIQTQYKASDYVFEYL